MTLKALSSDREFLQAYAHGGDEVAFRRLVERHLPMVQAVALRGSGDTDLSEEIAQNAFALLARKARRLSNAVTISGWLFQTARYETLRLSRKETTRLRKMKQHAQEAALTEMTYDSEPNFREPLDDALSQLNATDRNAVLLRFYDHLSYRELGEKLGKTEAAAQKQVERCLEKLRTRLARQGIPVSTAVIAAAFVSQFSSTAQAATVASLAQASILAAPTLSYTSVWINTLFSMASKSKLAASVTTIFLLLGFIAWQSSDLHASRLKIEELTDQLQATVPLAAAKANSADLVAPTSERGPSTEVLAAMPDEDALPPIVIPRTANESMRLWVRYKLKESAANKRYGNKVLPPGTPEREAYERDKERCLADLSTLAMAQGLLEESWSSNDVDENLERFEEGYLEAFELESSRLSKLLEITRSAIEAKVSSRLENPHGTPEATQAERVIQKEMIDRVSAVLSDEQQATFLGVFGRQPLTTISVNLPVIFDSEEQRADSIKNRL